MNCSNTHSSLAAAYQQGLRDVLAYGVTVPPVQDPTSPGSKFGREQRTSFELLGYTIRIDNPRSCLFFSPARLVRLPYAFGQFLWTIAGSDSVEWIAYYDPAAPIFATDGSHLRGAFGSRLFAYDGAFDQVEAIARRIEEDPASRRTVGVVTIPDDNFTVSRDYPCCVAVQYLLRNGMLHAITHMRSQSAFSVLPYDAFLFMAMQCILAARLSVQPGSYTHIAGSFHIYDDEIARAEQVIAQPIEPLQIGDMPDISTNLKALLAFERALRVAALSGNVDQMEHLSASGQNDTTFFQQAQTILVVYALATYGAKTDASSYAHRLPSPMRLLMLEFLKAMQ